MEHRYEWDSAQTQPPLSRGMLIDVVRADDDAYATLSSEPLEWFSATVPPVLWRRSHRLAGVRTRWLRAAAAAGKRRRPFVPDREKRRVAHRGCLWCDDGEHL